MSTTSWILNSLDKNILQKAYTDANRAFLHKYFRETPFTYDLNNIQFIGNALELEVIDCLNNHENINHLRKISSDAFDFFRVLPLPNDALETRKFLIRTACFGILADRSFDASKYLQETNWPQLKPKNWGIRALSTVLESWLYLIRKNGWNDLDNSIRLISDLREQQSEFEEKYLSESGNFKKTAAWELVSIYHLARAAELLSLYTSHGKTENNTFDIREQLESQFDKALLACQRVDLVELESLIHVLSRTAIQMVDNSIWSISRAVPTLVSNFIKNTVSRERQNPIFELLPPQRRALKEKGLIGAAFRSIVVNLPTSSGKTFIAEFRILQALNQFEKEKGWIAYIAPTRALVNQVCTRLRKDFSPLNIIVEKVSPALEVDGSEAELLLETDSSAQFRILVTTPEKLDLLIRGGWEDKIGRPLTLVVVDEAHNIGQKERGIKLELLLSTINRECRFSQFLLLTPFISNASKVAKWLSPDSYDDIDIGLDWSPNDLAIMTSKPNEGTGEHDFVVHLNTIHTNKETIEVPELIRLDRGRPLNFTYKKIKTTNLKVAAVTANKLKTRGPVIVLVQRPDWAWSLAKLFKKEENRKLNLSENIALVQIFLEREFGSDFELIDLLNFGIGVHHAGLSDEARALMEWLFENNELDILVATTTIAQGVNFPISGVVFAHYTYPDKRGTIEMPPEDFWNIVGRAGRVDQESLGIAVFACKDNEDEEKVKEFVKRKVTDLNSTLIDMVSEAIELGRLLSLDKLFHLPEWSSFLQYLVHSYRQVGDHEKFVSQIEQVLRGTLGFQELRNQDLKKANALIKGVENYVRSFRNKPLKLVDSTGFSLQSVMITLSNIAEKELNKDIWHKNILFNTDSSELIDVMGILLQVPELRDNLSDVLGGSSPDGSKLANIVTDWVNGVSIEQLAEKYFTKGRNHDKTISITECCRKVFGKLTQTAAWGLGALQSMTINEEEMNKLSPIEKQSILNIPAMVYYGVNSNEAVTLRLLGIPRSIANEFTKSFTDCKGLSQIREKLYTSNHMFWNQALGEKGMYYYKIWKILEGIN